MLQKLEWVLAWWTAWHLPPSELPFAERVLEQNISQENHLIFMRMTEQVTYIFIPIVSHKDSFCHRGESKPNIRLFIHELLREPLISTHFLVVLPENSHPCYQSKEETKKFFHDKVRACQTTAETISHFELTWIISLEPEIKQRNCFTIKFVPYISISGAFRSDIDIPCRSLAEKTSPRYSVVCEAHT